MEKDKVDKEEEQRRIKIDEDLVIYQKASNLAFNVAMTIFDLSQQAFMKERYSLTDQRRKTR